MKIILICIITSFLFLSVGSTFYYFNIIQRLPTDISIDSMLIFKSKRKMLVFSKGNLIKTYKISLGKNPVGRKEQKGDCKTPEGVYFINSKNPKSIAYKNIGISYPNSNDLKHSKSIGRPSGGDIKIHGLMNNWWFIGILHRKFDWTNGCIAVTNEEIDELSKVVKIGTKIEIVP